MGIEHHVLFLLVAVLAGSGRGAEPEASQALAPAARPEAVAMGADVGARSASEGPGVVDLPPVGGTVAGPGPAYRRSLWVPVLEVGLVVAGLNTVDRYVLGYEWARSTPRTFERNARTWQFDSDPFATNNLMHPYNGSIYYGCARSMGLDLWSSFGLASLGSALWEIGGETEPASANDQIMTSVGGSFLGEVLFRSAVLLLAGGGDAPGFWREAGAFLVSPPTGVNRLLFGDRYRTVDFDERPATYLEAFAGVAFDRAPPGGDGTATTAQLGLHLVYGLPGDDGWPVRRPFDHFDLQLGLRSAGCEPALTALLVRGMLAGSRIEGTWNGLWGLTGVYDYAAPGRFQVSTAGLGVSTAGQLGARGGVALQGAALLAAGFGTGGAEAASSGDPGNHRGPAAQLVLEARLLLSDRASIGAGLREYLVAGTGDTRGLEAQRHLTLSGRLRIAGSHAVGVEWMDARRWSRAPGVPDTWQRSSPLSVSYVLVTDRAFGARPRRAGPDRLPRNASRPAPRARRAGRSSRAAASLE